MKTLLLITMLLTAISARAQSVKIDPSFTDQKKYMIDTVCEAQLTKQQIYSNAIAFTTSRAQDYHTAIESKNLELGEVVFSGRYTDIVAVTDQTKIGKVKFKKIRLRVFFTGKVYAKDNKFKAVLSNLTYQTVDGLKSNKYDPVDSTYFKLENSAVTSVAMDIIKALAASLNRKPENDF